MHKLAQSVLGYIRKHDLLRPGDRAGIAVSGGADSVALLRLLLELRDELGVVLSVVHLNHRLRGADSDADEQFVRDLANSHGLEIASENHDVTAHAARNRLSLETAAREIRYEFFRRVLEARVNRIATAHTMDDQAETVLMKLARGAGTRGLAGIYPKVVIQTQPSGSKTQTEGEAHGERSIIRPLLGTRRSELKYLLEIGQTWREDITNQDMRYTRNRVRHQILPFLEKTINPSLCQVLADTAEIAREEEEYWAAEVDRLLPQVWRKSASGGSIDRAGLCAFPLAVQRRLVRAAARLAGVGLEFRHVEEVLCLEKEGSCAALPDAVVARLHAGEIEFQQARKETIREYQYVLPVPGRIVVREIGIEVEAILCSGMNEHQNYDPEHLVASSLLQGGLVIRNWRPGERFWPAHTKEPRKIKELLQDQHITGDRKKLWPVVA